MNTIAESDPTAATLVAALRAAAAAGDGQARVFLRMFEPWLRQQASSSFELERSRTLDKRL